MNARVSAIRIERSLLLAVMRGIALTRRRRRAGVRSGRSKVLRRREAGGRDSRLHEAFGSRKSANHAGLRSPASASKSPVNVEPTARACARASRRIRLEGLHSRA